MIISSHTATLLNYRMTVPVGSDILAYDNSPEVYYGAEITSPPFNDGERAVTEQVRKIRNYLFSDLTGKKRKYNIG